MNILQDKLAHNQQTANKYIVYNFCNGDHGIGSEFHMMVPSLSMAFQTNRALVITGPWIFASNTHSSNGHDFWFEPLVSKEVKTKVQAMLSPSVTSIGFDNIDKYPCVKVSPMDSYTVINEHYGLPPKEYEQHGPIWWKGKLLQFLMRPNDRLKKEIVKAQPSMLKSQPFIGLQVRHSNDWSSTTRFNNPLKTYMKYINNNEMDIFISTEDQAIIDECNKIPNKKFYYTQNARPNRNQAKAIISGKADGIEEGRIGLVNLFIMREASYFVGGILSNWGRLVLEHMYAIDNIPDQGRCYSVDAIPLERYKGAKLIEFAEYNKFYDT